MNRDYRYDAFISYRHLSLDKTVAERLQKLLENYKPPKKGNYQNINRIKRIFRDESELPTSGDLGADIKKALNESAFLIVVCSEETAKSKWCLEEIRYFKELHDGNNNRILTLLVSGDPKGVFPKELRYEMQLLTLEDGSSSKQAVEVEPLAANIVAESNARSLKKLKTEFLRIAAPILGCSYDDLYRRHQRRFIKRFVISSILISAAIISFGLFSYSQTVRIKTQSLEIRREKGLRTLDAAEMMIDDGDKVGATSIILDLIKNNPDNSKYIWEKTDYLLARSTYFGSFDKYAVLHQSNVINSCWFSKDGQFLYAASDDKTINIYKSQNGEKVKTFLHETGVVDMCVLNGHIFTVTKDFVVAEWDIQSGKKIKEMQYFAGDHQYSNIWRIISNSQNLYLYYYISDTGKQYIVKLDLDKGIGKPLYVLDEYSYSFSNSDDGRYFLIEKDNAVILYDSLNDDEKAGSLEGQEIQKVLFDKENNIIIISQNIDDDRFPNSILIVNSNGKPEARIGIDTDNFYQVTTAVISPDGRYLAIGWYSGGVSIYDIKNKIFLQEITLDTMPVNELTFTKNGEYLIVSSTLSGRAIDLWKRDDNQYTYYKEISAPANDVSEISINDTKNIMAVSSIDGTIHLYSMKRAFNERLLETNDTAIYGNNADDLTYNIKILSADLKYLLLSNYDSKAVKVVDKVSGETISEYKSDRGIMRVYPDLNFSSALIEEISSGEKYLIDLKVGKELYEAKIPIEYTAISLMDNQTAYILTMSSYLYKVDLRTGEILNKTKLDISVGAIASWKLCVNEEMNRVTVIGQYPRSIEEIGFVLQLSSGKKIYDLKDSGHFGEIYTNSKGSVVYFDLGRQTLETTIPTYERLIEIGQKQIDNR